MESCYELCGIVDGCNMINFEEGICQLIKIDITEEENNFKTCKLNISLKTDLLDNSYNENIKFRLGNVTDDFLNSGYNACKTVRHRGCDEDFTNLFGYDKLSKVLHKINDITDCEDACNDYDHKNSC